MPAMNTPSPLPDLLREAFTRPALHRKALEDLDDSLALLVREPCRHLNVDGLGDGRAGAAVEVGIAVVNCLHRVR